MRKSIQDNIRPYGDLPSRCISLRRQNIKKCLAEWLREWIEENVITSASSILFHVCVLFRLIKNVRKWAKAPFHSVCSLAHKRSRYNLFCVWHNIRGETSLSGRRDLTDMHLWAEQKYWTGISHLTSLHFMDMDITIKHNRIQLNMKKVDSIIDRTQRYTAW